MSDLGRALVDALDDQALEHLAERLGPRIAELVAERLADRNGRDRWMTSREAAEYLALSIDALHKLTAGREIPFSRDTPGGKCFFKRSELDTWRGL